MLFTSPYAVLSLCLAANAHLFISSPVPIEGTGIKPPLDPSGSDFPCHGVTLPSSGGTPMAAGSSQLLEFDDGGGANTATHGGGSCQISITYETDAAKLKDPKNWLVIYSIEGGCPTTSHGNLDVTGAHQCTGPGQVDCLNQFKFTIPKGVKEGHAILAWTWFNTIGNREMYMNCVNTQLTGGDGTEMDSFPSMFVANLASLGTCATTENTYVGFPSPGKYLTTILPPNAPTGDVFPISTPTAAACQQAVANKVASGATTSSITSSATSSHGTAFVILTGSASSTSTTSTDTAASAPSLQLNPSATGKSAANGPVTQTTMVTVTAALPQIVTSPTGVQSSTSTAGSGSTSQPNKAGSSGSCPGSSVNCSKLGGVVCIGTSQFGLCDVNMCAVPQALAAGTTCSNGVILKKRQVALTPSAPSAFRASAGRASRASASRHSLNASEMVSLLSRLGLTATAAATTAGSATQTTLSTVTTSLA